MQYLYRSVSIISSHLFTYKEVDHLMSRLGGIRDDGGWTLVRNDRKLTIDLGNEDLETMFDTTELREFSSLLGARPYGRISVTFNDSEDGFEALMALGLAKAVAEVWNTLLDDHMGETILVDPPR